MANERIVVLCTVGRAEDARRIASALVEQRLAACVSVVAGVTSVYRWRGQVEQGEEQLLLIKTRAERFESLKAAIVAQHPYEVPEVVSLAIEDGHGPYLAWLDESVR